MIGIISYFLVLTEKISGRIRFRFVDENTKKLGYRAHLTHQCDVENVVNSFRSKSSSINNLRIEIPID